MNTVVQIPKGLEDHKQIVDLFKKLDLCNPGISVNFLNANTVGMDDLEKSNIHLLYNFILEEIYKDPQYTGDLYHSYLALADAQDEYDKAHNNPVMRFVATCDMDFVFNNTQHRLHLVRIGDQMFIRTIQVNVGEDGDEPVYENI